MEMRSLVLDHVVRGRVVFPGAAYLEMARAMACEALDTPSSSARLTQLFFLQPLVIDDGTRTAVECALDVNSGELTVRSRDGSAAADESALHFSAVVSGDVHRLPQLPRVSEMRSCVSRAMDGTALYGMFWSAGLEYGPAHRTLEAAWISRAAATRHALGRLRVRREWQGTQVHPADLDGALQLPMALAEPPTGRAPPTLLPFAADAVWVGGGVGRLWPVRMAQPAGERRLQPMCTMQCASAIIHMLLSVRRRPWCRRWSSAALTRRTFCYCVMRLAPVWEARPRAHRQPRCSSASRAGRCSGRQAR